jgi:hypothetical protein
MDLEVDLVADLNAEDHEGSGWSTSAERRHPDEVRAASCTWPGTGMGGGRAGRGRR